MSKENEKTVSLDDTKKSEPIKLLSPQTVKTVNSVISEPIVQKPKVSLKVFLQISGMAPTAYAGFLWWAKTRKLRTETIDDWWTLFNDHQKRPVR